MSKRIEICEVVKHYHVIEVDDEVDVGELVRNVNYSLSKYDSGCEALSVALDKIKNTYGLDYEIKCNYCGTEVDGLSVVDEVE